MRRRTYGSVFLLVPLGLVLGAPLAASASSAAQKHAHTVQCANAATGHKKVTKAEMTACTLSTLTVTRPCPKGSTIFVVSKGTTYALRSGAKPARLPKHASLAVLNKACGLSTPLRLTRAHAVPAPATTTTSTNDHTTAPPPPTTTATATAANDSAAPAGCTPCR